MLLHEKETVVAAVVHGLKASGMSESDAQNTATANYDGWSKFVHDCRGLFGYSDKQKWVYALGQVREAAKKGPVAPGAPSPQASMRARVAAPAQVAAPKAAFAPAAQPDAPKKGKK